MKKSILIFVVLAIAAGFAAIWYINKNYAPATSTYISYQNQTPTPPVQSPAPAPSTPTSTPKASSKTTLLLSVPFTPQAPTGNWDTIHNEDCEEASTLMANAYYNGPHDVKLDPAYVETQLTKMTDWELQTFGYNLDITSEEVVKMITANYGLQTKILYNFTEDDIKNELQQNHLILIPVNGQLIGNPNYKQPGPKYHVLVIRGYSDDPTGVGAPTGASEHPSLLITNDPGTRNGLNYSYPYDTLYNANGDWSHDTNSVDLSKKNVLVVWK